MRKPARPERIKKPGERKNRSVFEPDFLTARRQIFITEYMKDFNPQRAAIAAGYAAKSAQSGSSWLLAQPPIRKEIQRRLDEAAKRSELTTDWIVSRQMEVVERAMKGDKKLDGPTANQGLGTLSKIKGLYDDTPKSQVAIIQVVEKEF